MIIKILDELKLVMAGIICSALTFGISIEATADTFELEVCEYKGKSKTIGSQGETTPPGLDEKLNCDHKCFYEELEIDPIVGMPTLQDMYSIGWRIINIIEHSYNRIPLWTVYLERKKGVISQLFPNDCENIYSGK